MSFEIKYDAEGMPIKTPMPEFAEPIAEIEALEAQTDLQEEEQEQVIEQAPQVEQPRQESPAQESWKILREKAERAEKRAAELEAELRKATSNQAEEAEEDLGFSIDEDALAEGKHLNKVNKKIQRLENQVKQYEQQATMVAIENRLKARYPDFDSVVSTENLSNLAAAYPEIANAINDSRDLHSKAVAAYTMIKKLGIAPQEDSFQAEKLVAHKNAAKPKPLASISPQQGDSPLSKANAFANGGELTDDLKKQMWREMNQYRK